MLLAFGDSLTYGTGANPSASYPSRLAEHLDMRVVNAGVPGETSKEGLLRLPSLLQEHQPALVIICHGGNDILRGMPMPSLETALREMISLVRNSGADAVMLAVPGRNLVMNPPDLYRRVADDMEVPIDAETLPALVRNRSMKSDRVHLNDAGYARLADALHQLMLDAGSIVD